MTNLNSKYSQALEEIAAIGAGVSASLERIRRLEADLKDFLANQSDYRTKAGYTCENAVTTSEPLAALDEDRRETMSLLTQETATTEASPPPCNPAPTYATAALDDNVVKRAVDDDVAPFQLLALEGNRSSCPVAAGSPLPAEEREACPIEIAGGAEAVALMTINGPSDDFLTQLPAGGHKANELQSVATEGTSDLPSVNAPCLPSSIGSEHDITCDPNDHDRAMPADANSGLATNAVFTDTARPHAEFFKINDEHKATFIETKSAKAVQGASTGPTSSIAAENQVAATEYPTILNSAPLHDGRANLMTPTVSTAALCTSANAEIPSFPPTPTALPPTQEQTEFPTVTYGLDKMSDNPTPIVKPVQRRKWRAVAAACITTSVLTGASISALDRLQPRKAYDAVRILAVDVARSWPTLKQLTNTLAGPRQESSLINAHMK